MFEYFILETLLLILLHYNNKLHKKTYIFTIILCTLVAITDELHQLFISGRSSRPIDVFIDSIGAIIAVTLYHKLTTKKHVKANLD